MTASAPLSEIDALDPTLYVRGVAHDVFRWLRENDPVHWDEKNNLWVITKYEDISHVERHPQLFSSAQGVRPRGGGGGELSLVSMDDPLLGGWGKAQPKHFDEGGIFNQIYHPKSTN